MHIDSVLQEVHAGVREFRGGGRAQEGVREGEIK